MRNYTIRLAVTKALISFAVTAKVVCAFVFGVCRFSVFPCAFAVAQFFFSVKSVMQTGC